MSAGSTDLPMQRILGVSSFSVLRCSRTSSSEGSEMCSHLFCFGDQLDGMSMREGRTNNKNVGVLRLHARRHTGLHQFLLV